MFAQLWVVVLPVVVVLVLCRRLDRVEPVLAAKILPSAKAVAVAPAPTTSTSRSSVRSEKHFLFVC